MPSLDFSRSASPRRFCLRILLPLLALHLGGCALLAPVPDIDQRQPEITLPDTWQQPLPQAGDSPATWWRRFNDPLLDELIDKGLASAPDLRIAQSRLRQARIRRDQATAGWYPGLDFSSGVSRSPGNGSATSTSYSAGFSASWEADLFGEVRYGVDAAERDLAAEAARFASSRISLAAEITLNYVQYRATQERLAIARKSVQMQEETFDITLWRARAGLVTELDVEQGRASLEQTRASIPSLENSLVTGQNQLETLLGLVPGALGTRLAEVAALPDAPETIAVDIPSEALRQRPDVRAAEQTLLAEAARFRKTAATRLPSLNFSGRISWQDAHFSALGGSETIARSLAASLAAPIFDAGNIRNQIALQEIAHEQAVISYEQTLLAALQEVESALSSYATGRRREVNRIEAARAATSAATMARQMYESGLVDFQKVLDTQRTLLSAEDSLVTTKSDILTSVIQLYKSLGGGWEAAPPEEAASPESQATTASQ
ncbi:MAG: TolC family protein [Zoogloeaceae bacterium]|jgi:NodT family efflux transporter outer membrane factor (OMF) lipoprotein|nr:TolC family protein [Zoogloeaceae bacterium]